MSTLSPAVVSVRPRNALNRRHVETHSGHVAMHRKQGNRTRRGDARAIALELHRDPPRRLRRERTTTGRPHEHGGRMAVDATHRHRRGPGGRSSARSQRSVGFGAHRIDREAAQTPAGRDRSRRTNRCRRSADDCLDAGDVTGPHGARGVEPGWTALGLMDGGARSPMETRIRLALIDGGLPAPRAGIVVGSGPAAAVIGMGWERAKVGVSYCEPEEVPLVQRILRAELLHELGWFEIQVIDEHSTRMMVLRAHEALRLHRR